MPSFFSPLHESLAVVCVATVVLLYSGWAPSYWLTPAEFRAYRLLLRPFLGYVVIVVLGYPLATLGLSLPLLTWILFGATTVMNMAALSSLRSRHRRVPQANVAVPLVMALAALILALLPLIAYGTYTIIGYNGDGVMYVAQAEFAKAHSFTAEGMLSNPSPLARTAADWIDVGTGAGFQLFHSLLSTLTGRDAFYLFVPLMSLWHAVALLSTYILYRVSFRFASWNSSLGVAVLALNGLFLWIDYDNFAQQVAALALLPLALAALDVYTRERTRPSLILAALLLAVLILTYPEILPFYAGPAFILFLLMAWREPRRLRRTISAVASLGGASFLVAPTAYQMLIQHYLWFLPAWAARTAGNVTAFIGVDEAIGVNLLKRGTNPFIDPLDSNLLQVLAFVSAAAVFVLLLFLLVGLWHAWRSNRLPLVAAAIGIGGLLATTYLSAYAYGYFKGWANSLFVVIGLGVFGIEVTAKWIGNRKNNKLLLAALATIVALILSLEGASMSWLLTQVALQPPPVTPRLISLSRNKKLLPPGASLFLGLGDGPNPRMYWAAYLLRDRPIYGHGVLYGYRLDNAKENTIYDFALLTLDSDPVVLGYSSGAQVWRDRWTALYEKQR